MKGRAAALLVLWSLLVAVLAACSPGGSQPPKVLRIGVLPDQSEAVLQQRYDPLLRYLADAVGISTELVIPSSYDDLLARFEKGELHLAYFGGFTFTRTHHRGVAKPLVMRDIDLRFKSYFLTRADGGSKPLTDFKGQRFAFGSRLSTSGHLMPRHFLNQKGLSPETFFGEVKYSGAHDRTALWVRDGIADIGVANASIIDEMFTSGRLKRSEVQIVWETPHYPDYIWAAHHNLGSDLCNRILIAFLKLSSSDPVQAKILERVNAGGFVPARIDDFSELSKIAGKLGLL